jgi:hypothetical protein
LGARALTSPPICKALSNNALNRFRRAFHIANVKSYALTITEVEFGKVAFQMFLADMVVHAIDAALEDRKLSFDCICVDVAANIFANAVIDG